MIYIHTMASMEILSASLEDYLEAIFHIVTEKQAARATDIAKRLAVNNSSVTGALRALSEKNLINYTPYDVITLTPDGRELATEIVRKHEALQDFFIKILKVDKTEAEDAACKMEHTVSRTILDRLIRFTHFLDVCPRCGKTWIKEFWKNCELYCEHGRHYENCEACISACLNNFKKKKEKANFKKILLKEMNQGQKGKILKLRGRDDLKKRLEKMGLTPGSIVEVENVFSENNAIDIKVKGYHHSLTCDDASKITIELYM